MASGWAKDGAVQDQIDASIAEAVDRARQQLNQPGSARVQTGDKSSCEDCGETIPAARISALPNTTVCVTCQEERDQTNHASGKSALYNRRGSKDSQLR